MSRFVFMLTRNDETIPEARARVDDLALAGVRHAGCKDVGLPEPELAALLGELRSAGMTTYLEVVSVTPEATIRSARAALRLRPDYLVGGTQRRETAAILAGSGICHFPYVGGIVGHPCLLRGSIDWIAADAAAATAEPGVDGVNLLAYRYDGDVERLVAAVVAAASGPVLCAGSVDSPARIEALRRLGAWGSTIGTAILDGVFQPGRTFVEQLRAAVELAGEGDPAPA